MPSDDDKLGGQRPAQALPRGASIGRYVVLGLVGKGGMGEVYAAYDPELDRKVAVKLLRVQLHGVSPSEGRTRTVREAQAIAKLSHPNVVVVYDVGTFRDEVFIAMEFLDGNTAGYWVQAKSRSWQEVLKVYLAAGHGLVAAHEKNLVHRDFKPDNVMVGRDGQVRVMDFGLARHVNDKSTEPLRTPPGGTTARNTPAPPLEGVTVEDDDLESTLPMARLIREQPEGVPMDLSHGTSSAFDARLTRTGAMMGTPAYMSPEQFLGTGTDARTDQFSFCVALYEGLYGERPFSGKTLFGLTSTVVQGKVSDAPANTKVPLWVRKVLLRGLKADANARYPSMQDLLTALGHNPATARRKVLLATAAVLLPLVVGVGVRQSMNAQKSMCAAAPEKLAGIWELENSRETESARKATIREALLGTGKPYAANVYANVSRALNSYVKAWSDMYRSTCEATHVRGEQSAEVLDLRMSCLNERLDGVKALTQVFTEADNEVVEKAVSAVHALPELDRCADVSLLRAMVRPPDDPTTRAKVDGMRHRLAEVKALDDAGRFARAHQKALVLVDEARALQYTPLIAEALSALGRLQYELGDARTAERTFDEAYWVAEMSRHDEVRAEVASGQVWVVGFMQGRYAEGERWAHHGEAVLKRLGGHERLQSWVINNLSAVYDLQGRSADALKAQQQALRLKEKVLPLDHPDVAGSLANTAICFKGVGRNQEALEYIDRALTIFEKGVGPQHPEFANQISNRGEILRTLGRAREARVSFERALVIWERELGRDHLMLAYALTGIGETYLDARDPSSAIAPLERAFKIRTAKASTPSFRAETSFALARALWNSRRDPERAQTLVVEAKSGYAKAGLKAKVAEVESWMAAHGPSDAGRVSLSRHHTL